MEPRKINAPLGVRKAGMNALREMEEDAVTRHGVRDAGAGQDHDVERPEGGEGHGHREPDCTARAGKRLHYIRRNVLGRRYLLRTAKRGSKRHSPSGTEPPTVSSPRMMARGIFFCGLKNFFAQIAKIVEAVVGPHGGNEGGQQSANRSQTELAD